MNKLAVLLCFLGAACSSTSMVKFEIRAIDSNEKELTCAIFNENDLFMNAKNEPVKTPAWVDVPFHKKSEGSGYEGARIVIRAVEVDAEGKVVRGLQEGDAIPYLEDIRVIYPTDAKRQLFILRKNKSAGN